MSKIPGKPSPSVYRVGAMAAVPAMLIAVTLSACSHQDEPKPSARTTSTMTSEYLPPPPAPKTALQADGLYAVGPEIAPGIYVAPGGPECAWERVPQTIEGEENQPIPEEGHGEGEQRVELTPADRSFQTTGCGAWNPAPPEPAASGTPMEDAPGEDAPSPAPAPAG